MAEYANTEIQLVPVGANVLFDETPVKGTKCIQHRDGSGLITLRGITNQCNARFKATFSGNIAVPTGQTPGAISVALALNGEAIGSTNMVVTPGAVNGYFNVAAPVYINIPSGCCQTLSVRNTSTIPINVQNANLVVERTA